MAVDDGAGRDDDAAFNWWAFAAMSLCSVPLFATWRAVGPDHGVLDFVGGVLIAALLIGVYHRVDRRAARRD